MDETDVRNLVTWSSDLVWLSASLGFRRMHWEPSPPRKKQNYIKKMNGITTESKVPNQKKKGCRHCNPLTNSIRSTLLIPTNCIGTVTHPKKEVSARGLHESIVSIRLRNGMKGHAPCPQMRTYSSVPETTTLAPLGPEMVSPRSVGSHRSPLPWISTLQLPAQTDDPRAGS